MNTSPLLFSNELERVDSFSSEYNKDNFLKGLSISPDGSCILTYTEENYVKILALGSTATEKYKYYTHDNNTSLVTENVPSLGLQLSVNVGESIFDVKWYPHMSSENPSSNCFITTARDHPITLWDTETGSIRATYSGINHLDELDPAVSLAFNLTGDRIYAGSNKMIRCFDISRPGRDGFTAIPTSKCRKSPLGQKGLISTLAFNPDHSGAYAAGSYANSIGVYVENSRECVFQIDEMEFGVTCLRWSPCGRYLWAGGRQHSQILCWDVRQTGQCVGSVHRRLQTNQRLTFDLDPWGKYIATGDMNGDVLVYSTETFELVRQFHTEENDTERGVSSAQSSSSSSSGNDSNSDGNCAVSTLSDSFASRTCVNSVAFHPYCSLLITGSGERTFHVSDDDNNNDSDSDCEQHSGGNDVLVDSVGMKQQSVAETSVVRIWSIDKTPLAVPISCEVEFVSEEVVVMETTVVN